MWAGSARRREWGVFRVCVGGDRIVSDVRYATERKRSMLLKFAAEVASVEAFVER